MPRGHDIMGRSNRHFIHANLEKGLAFFLLTYSPLRQFVNMCPTSLEYSSFFISRVLCIAINFALKLFCRPASLIASSK